MAYNSKASSKMPRNYINYFDVAKDLGINPNTAKARIGTDGLEGIKDIEVLKPIAHLFREFPKGQRKQYGILRRHYDTWKQTGYVPKVSPGRPPKWTGEEKHINIPAPPFYEKFLAGVKKANQSAEQQVTVRQVIYLSMKQYMDRFPAMFGVDSNEKDSIQPTSGNKG